VYPSSRLPAAARTGLSRRTALTAFGTGAIALAVAGCKSGPVLAKPSAATLAKDALGPVYTETLALMASYDTAIANNPALAGLLGPLREDHRQHAVALAALMSIAAPAVSPGPNAAGTPMPALPSPAPTVVPSSPPPPPSPAPANVAGTAPARAQLSAAEKTAIATATDACLTAPADRVAVLASIVASRATHVAALR
jgi:hypothetical protein